MAGRLAVSDSGSVRGVSRMTVHYAWRHLVDRVRSEERSKGVKTQRSSAAPCAEEKGDAAAEGDAPENRRQGDPLFFVRGGLDGPHFQNRFTARVGDALVGEGHQTHRDEHYADDDEREFHEGPPFHYALTLGVAVSR